VRPEESEYWDHVARQVKGHGVNDLNDNIWKRCEIVRRILSHRPIDWKILEIGVGQGLGAAVFNLLTLGHNKYLGTDVSAEFCRFVAKRWKLPVVQTDILKLPDGPFDMIWAFDTLEHVRPEDRKAGYEEMGRVLGKPGLILINMPLNESGHEPEFDWGMKEEEAFELARVIGGHVTVFEPYDITEIEKSYAWVEICRT
jgi:SAM-dependent methyltransferase